MRWLDRRIAKPGPHLTLCLTADEARAAAKHIKYPGEFVWPERGACVETLRTPDGRLVCIVCINEDDWRGRNPVEVAGVLVHEAVHVWQRYADDIGEEQPGREQEAYAIQAIAQELMAEFARRLG